MEIGGALAELADLHRLPGVLRLDVLVENVDEFGDDAVALEGS